MQPDPSLISELESLPNNIGLKARDFINNLVNTLRLDVFTVATLPAASTKTNQLVYVSDGFTPGLYWSNGSTWSVFQSGAGEVSPGRPPSDSHTLLWYKFDEAIGATTVVNYGTLGTSKNLTTAGTPVFGQGGPFSSGMYVGSGYAYGADSVEPAQLTMSAWVRRISNSDGWIIDKGYQAGATWLSPWYSAAISFWSSLWGANVYSSGAKEAQDLGPVGVPGVRYYLVGTYDGVDVKLYVDGKLRRSVASGAIDYGNHGRWNIGANSAGAEFGHSIIDDVQICDVARDATWVLAAYRAGMGWV